MGNLVLAGATSGSITLEPTAVAGSNTLTLPAATGTILTTASSGQIIPKAALPTGSVLQVVSTTKTDTFSSSSTTFVDITGFSVSITPTSSSSKILITGVLTASTGLESSITGYAQLVRGSTAIGNGTDGLATQNAGNNDFTTQWVINYLDSPATTSSTTYKVQLKGDGATWYVNRPANRSLVGSSTITVMEIAA